MICSDIFNSESICIFTDSSFKNESKNKSYAIGTTAPAYCVYNGFNLIEQNFHILHNSTSQKGELYAINLGVNAAYRYRNFPHIRLFSDSMNSIFAIRDRIFNWVRDTNNGINVLGECGRISNQDYIMNIVYDILMNNIPIEFYHVKGHVNVNKYSDILNAKKVFETSNLFPGYKADESLIYQISVGNDLVDRYSTDMLRMNLNNPRYNIDGLSEAVTISYVPFNVSKYMTLVNKKGKENNIAWTQ